MKSSVLDFPWLRLGGALAPGQRGESVRACGRSFSDISSSSVFWIPLELRSIPVACVLVPFVQELGERGGGSDIII